MQDSSDSSVTVQVSKTDAGETSKDSDESEKAVNDTQPSMTQAPAVSQPKQASLMKFAKTRASENKGGARFSLAANTSKAKPRRTTVVDVKSQPHPWDGRLSLDEAYENPITERESWWRCQIRVTPNPGYYGSSDFIQELQNKRNTYGFRSTGRIVPCGLDRSGPLLLPGGYEHTDFISRITEKPATYRFKAESRDAFDVLNFGQKDKNINVAPNQYAVENYLSVSGEKQPVKNFMFKSQSRRFPTSNFQPREGPSPGSYNVRDLSLRPPSVTSSFRSKTPRFHTSHTSWI